MVFGNAGSFSQKRRSSWKAGANETVKKARKKKKDFAKESAWLSPSFPVFNYFVDVIMRSHLIVQLSTLFNSQATARPHRRYVTVVGYPKEQIRLFLAFLISPRATYREYITCVPVAKKLPTILSKLK